jgi:4-phospho-D-threonate 3-dehydrogenase / 4-phospho-D-erythronate 3-dehydrogenase
MADRPRIAITMGDAAGIGPEIIVKSLGHPELYEKCRPIVLGDASRLEMAAEITNTPLEIHPVEGLAGAQFRAGTIDCLDLRLLPIGLPFGHLSKECGAAAYGYIVRAVELACSHDVDAICTAPINKSALHAAGYHFPGHTELLAQLTHTPEVSMMLIADNLRVIHVTTHIGLLDAIGRIEPGLVFRTIKRAHETLLLSGITTPRIAVCGINPHAGEGGLFGRGEELDKIVPAVASAQALGLDVSGPLPADTLFFRARRGDFDIIVAMYHDQGHGPVKVLGLDTGVNITVGLPVIRTSVDHGTAFDIAGTGRADERSMLAAIFQAVELAPKLPR